MTVYPLAANFTTGEVSPLLHARVDIDLYRNALKTCTNFTVVKTGGLRKRPGFKYVKEVKDSSKKARLVPFVFSTTQAYVLEMGETYARFLTGAGIITTGGGTITGITKANPAVVTLNAHGFNNGERVLIVSVTGMVEVNNREFTVANKTANTFELSGVNSTGYTTFTAGGTAKKIVEIVTPYAEAELPAIDWAGSADTLGVVHQSHAPREIVRASDTSWSIASAVFRDGPFTDEPLGNTTTIAPDRTGAIHLVMTSNSAPSGVVSDDAGDTDPYKVFDLTFNSTTYVNAADNGWVRFYCIVTFPGLVQTVAVANSYWVTAHAKTPKLAPTSWFFEGYDGSVWHILDRQENQTSWGGGQTRYFEFYNREAYEAYRLRWLGVADDTGTTTKIAQIGIGWNGDYSSSLGTDSSGVVTLTFSATTFVNGGAGFTASDVGRHLRILGTDGIWRWFFIETVTSTTVIKGRLYGYSLHTLKKIRRWKLGAWATANYPSKIGFYERRRVFARSPSEPFTLWGTKTDDFYDHGVSSPLLNSDAIRFNIFAGKADPIEWLVEGNDLIVGTASAIRTFGKSNDQSGFGATNVQQFPKARVGASSVKPAVINDAVLFVDRFGKALREFIEGNDGAPELSVLAEHLLRSGVLEVAYQESPDSLLWVVMNDGSLATMTYDRNEKIVAFARQAIAIGDTATTALVESVACIPDATSKRDAVWIIVKRTIGGVTKRYIEVLAPEFTDAATADGVFLDSAISYSGAAVNTLSGAFHLAGRTVSVLADGQVITGLVVSATGIVTLPGGATAAKITVGLPYTSTIATLAVTEAGQRDGTAYTRRKLAATVTASVYQTLGLKAKGVHVNDVSFNVLKRDDTIDPIGGQMVQRTGNYPVDFQTSWRDDGQFILYSDDPLPCFLRGLVLAVTGEP